MKQINIFRTTVRNKITIAVTSVTVFFIMHSVYAQAQTLGNAKKALGDLKTDLIDNIIPLAAAIILLCLAIGYAGRYIEKDTFVRWAIGVVVAGSSTQLVTMLFAKAG